MSARLCFIDCETTSLRPDRRAWEIGLIVRYPVIVKHPDGPDTNETDDHEQAEAAYEQAVRQRWRALALVIKAKLEAVASGITTVEDEFLAHIVIPGTGGITVGQYTLPRIAQAYSSGRLPELMPGGQS